MSAGVYPVIQSYVCERIPYSACLQVYAIQCYVCGHVPYIAFVCRCVPYHTALCLQAYTVQCLLVCRCMPYSAMYHTSRLSVGVYHIIQSYVCKRIPYSACLQVYAIQRYVCGHVPYIALVCRRIPYHTEPCPQAYTLSYRAMSASVYRTVLVCRCMPYSVMSAGMYHTSRLSVGVYHIIQRYVCRRIPCSACLSAGVCHTVLCTIHRACL